MILLLIGRNIAFLPIFDFRNERQTTEDLRKNVIEKFLKSENRTYSIYYKDLTTGEDFGINENKVITGASLNKLLIISHLYNLASQGKIDLEDKIVIQKSDIQDYGTGSIRYNGEGKAYSLKQLAMLALEQSDNTAAYVLSIRLGQENIQNYGKKIGLSVTNMAENKTSAREMGTILEMIYKGEITGDTLKNELLDFMKDTDFEDRLARDIKDSVSVYHKAADAVGMVHDVGIIDDKKNPFILSVLTTDITNEEEAKKNIGKLANFIYGDHD
jgi:beta-lactamase class A